MCAIPVSTVRREDHVVHSEKSLCQLADCGQIWQVVRAFGGRWAELLDAELSGRGQQLRRLRVAVSDQTVAQGEGDGGGARGDPEPLADLPQVVGDGVPGDAETGGDLLVRQPLNQQPQDVALA